MNCQAMDRASAGVYASWFRCLADPSRVLILNLVARQQRPLSVGEIVEALDIAQATVSQHLKRLADVGFVLVDHVGTSSLFRVNPACLSCFPTAADVVMGRLPAVDPGDPATAAPWHRGEQAPQGRCTTAIHAHPGGTS